MSAPSSRHLSYDFHIYKGLSLRELMFTIVMTSLSFCLAFILVGFMTGWVVAFGCLGFLLGFIVSVWFMPKRIANFKAGKPHGYLLKVIRLRMAILNLTPSPYLHFQGIWQKSKGIGKNHV